METKEVEVTERVKRINPYRSGKFRWAVYPDYWKKTWGEIPLLGHVSADEEFYAVREAYARNLLPVNFTFGAKVVKVGPSNINTSK